LSILNLRCLSGIGLVVLCLTFGCSTQQKVSASSIKASKDRKQAPDFKLKDVNGKTVHLSDYRGKAVVLDFWATWCGPCKIEIPWFIQFERKYKDRGLEVLGVAMDDEGWQVVKPFAEQMKINYRLVMGDDLTADMYGGIEALPTTFLVDREGKIAAVHVGLAGKDEFENDIEKILDGSVVSVRNDPRSK
jgi:peroxiredoxin